MSVKVKYGNQQIERDSPVDITALLQCEEFQKQVRRHMQIAVDHAHSYPLTKSARSVTIKLEFTPNGRIDEDRRELVYSAGTFRATVGSPTLPATPVDFKCSVVNGKPYYNVESPDNPQQLTFRDKFTDAELYGGGVDGKSTAAGE